MTIERIILIVLVISQIATIATLVSAISYTKKFMFAQNKLNDTNLDLWVAVALKNAKDGNE